MMTHELAVSMLSAPLAAIDRRALSQAWYSALRLSSNPPPGGAPVRATHAALAVHAGGRSGAANALPLKTFAPGHVLTKNAKGPGEISVTERRSTRLPLAARIGRTLREPQLASRHSSIRVGCGAARVMVLLHTDARGTRLVALCAPRMRETVERALAQARFSLAARGIGIDVRAEGEAACS